MGDPPTARLETGSLAVLAEAIEKLDRGFSELPPIGDGGAGGESLGAVLDEVVERLRDNYPYFHPLYAGQMLKPPHPVARTAYALAMWLNPNNHALDGGRASSRMEVEAVAELAGMFGWKTHLGHLTGGGTMANLEALWVAGRLHPGTTVVASTQGHYTHGRITDVLGMDFEPVACDARGRIDCGALERRLEEGGIGTVVATIGTTGTGSVDPLAPILRLRERYGFRLHADAAYGGYFGLADNLSPETREIYELVREVDSIVIDPHKHGLQPYGCGCVLFRDPSVGRFYDHESPYTYFSSDELHLGEISLECSRPGAAAVGLWATQRLLPLVHGGEFAAMLGSSRAAALDLHGRLASDDRFIAPLRPELDIVVWALRAGSVSESSTLARSLFAEAERHHLYLALADLPVELFEPLPEAMGRDAESITCLRSVLMKAEHERWIDAIWSILDEVTARVFEEPRSR